MSNTEMEKYCSFALENGATHASQIHPSTIVTASWVRFKCQFGCINYNKSYCCPPDSPTPEQTRAIIDSYHLAILFHIEAPKTKYRAKRYKKFINMLRDLEGDIFKDGYYKAILFLCGPCNLCKGCEKLKGDPCAFGDKARPSMEASGIDVFQTVRNNGFFIETLREKDQTHNSYCLMLVD